MSNKAISVGVFKPIARMSGGMAYREALCNALRKEYDVEVFDVTGERGIVPSVRLRRMAALASVSGSKDVWVRDFFPVAGMSVRRNPGKNIALFHHLYTEGEGGDDALGRCFEALFRRNVRKCDCVVVVSEFWKEYFDDLGIDGVRVIRNALDPAEFDFDPRGVEAFRKKHGLTDSPIVYIGNCRGNKGVVEAHEALRGQGYQLVTSGEPKVELPCLNLNLPYDEYLLLLKAASVVVTMSKFREGWCRTAHEAMLSGTPVVGSGEGGMAELLEGGGQPICRDYSDLPNMVKSAIERRDRLGEDGRRFAGTMTLERFAREWVELVAEVAGETSRPERHGG